MRLPSIILHAFLVISFLPGGALAREPALVEAAGKLILALEVKGALVRPEKLSELVPFSEGSELRPELVREGIVRLYSTGLYDKVEVFLKDSPGGVVVRYSLTPKKWLEKVKFSGNLYLDDGELLSKIELRSSEEVTEGKLAGSVDRILEYYRYRGFAGSRVNYVVETDERSRSRVTFTVQEGRRQFVSDVRLSGDPGLSRTRLLSIITSMPGSRFDGEDLDSDLNRIREHLRKKMYLTPSLTYRVRPETDFPDGVLIVFEIRKGPAFRLQVRMSDQKESEKLVKKARSVFLKSATPDKAVLAMEKHILDRYRGDGYPLTTVNVDDGPGEGDSREITFEVDTGLLALIGDIQIEGVTFFNEERLDKTLGIAPGDPFVKSVMEESVENLGNEYRREGFLSLEITRHPLNFVARPEHQQVMIRLDVTEGPRNMIRSLSIEGNPLPEEDARRILGAAEGDPYVPEIIDEGIEDLLQALGGKGYLYASATVEKPEIQTDHTVDLVVKVSAGPQVRLGSVTVTGNESVDARIIRRALDLDLGEVLTRDKIIDAQDRIYDLKVMTSVDVQLADPQVPGAHKDITVQVKERPKYVLGVRLGYGSEDKLRGEFSVTNRNFRQMARSLSLRAKASSIERSTTLLYTHPWFQSLPIDMSVSLSNLFEERESYSRDSLSVAVEFVRALSERTESRFGYFFEGLKLSDVAPDAQLSPDDEGQTDVAALFGEILHDTRDDFLDPWSGVLGDILLEYAATPLGSRTEYVKTEVGVRHYMKLRASLVLAGLLRLGRVTAYGDSEEVIISKRFFLGGANSVRGYQLDSLGPRDSDGDPIGGNFMVNANLELRHPLFKTLRGAIFLDSGSIWLDRAADPENEKFKLRAAAGAGLRWTSPIGPLSLDYGYKLNPVPADEGDRYRWHFSIGHAF